MIIQAETSGFRRIRIFYAHSTQKRLSGIKNNLPIGIAWPQRLQLPNSGSAHLSKANLSLSNLDRACVRAASLMLLLLMASIRLTRPMEFSGAIGFVSSSSSAMSLSVSEMESSILVLSSLRSFSVIRCKINQTSCRVSFYQTIF